MLVVSGVCGWVIVGGYGALILTQYKRRLQWHTFIWEIRANMNYINIIRIAFWAGKISVWMSAWWVAGWLSCTAMRSRGMKFNTFILLGEDDEKIKTLNEK